MSETTRTVLIAIGVALLVIILVPVLAMMGMMGTMGGGGMNGMMGGRGLWVMGPLVLLILVAGIALVVIGTRRR